MAVRDEAEARALFDERYGVAAVPAAVEVEQAVIGADFGANGYTTRAQADLLAGVLGLRPGTRLLDVGSGRGWPGLYLAASTGCDVVLADLPVQGMRVARERALADGLAGQVATAVASARHLPFRPESFDALVHTDVLC